MLRLSVGNMCYVVTVYSLSLPECDFLKLSSPPNRPEEWMVCFFSCKHIHSFLFQSLFVQNVSLHIGPGPYHQKQGVFICLFGDTFCNITRNQLCYLDFFSKQKGVICSDRNLWWCGGCLCHILSSPPKQGWELTILVATTNGRMGFFGATR